MTPTKTAPEALDDVLHVYAQAQWHSDAFICGDLKGLTALRDAIDAAIKTGRGKVDAFTNDGEGYDLNIAKVSPQQASALVAPYTSDIATGLPSESALLPWTLFR